MAKIMVDENGESHIRGAMLVGWETLCGNVETGHKYTYTTGTPTCNGCINVAQELLEECTAKEIKSWRIK